jgi:cellobiose phosphorylase
MQNVFWRTVLSNQPLDKLKKLFFRVGRSAEEETPQEEPFRAELLGIDQLEQLARELATAHQLQSGTGSDILLTRLAENDTILQSTYQLVSEAVANGQVISPASEWLLDNFYLVEEQIRLIRRHFPKGYSRQLPTLSNGPHRGYPRVYDLMLRLISHLDGRVDGEALDRFMTAYQGGAALSLGELWAVPIMLRLALVENMRRVAAAVASARQQRNVANYWADELISAAERTPDDTIVALAAMVKSNPPLSSAFITELVRRLQGQSASLALALNWIGQLVARSSETIELLVQRQSRRQAADQISMGNCFGSLRFIDAMDWRDFVEAQSMVEKILREDPAGIYPAMDFRTRDRYRHVVEEIAVRNKLPEQLPARRAVELATAAKQAMNPSTPACQAHVGFYLIGEGRRELEHALQVRPTLRQAIGRHASAVALPVYLTLIAVLTAGFTWPLISLVTGHPRLALLAAILTAFPMSQVALALINYAATLLIAPQTLPRMDFSNGVPDTCRTIVVVPCLLENAAEIDALLESLEVRYLANRDPNVHFALASDFCDAPEQFVAADEPLLRKAIDGIEALNIRYGRNERGPFCLFHRPRQYNSGEGVWMGSERKRGKLEDLINLLRDDQEDAFLKIIGDLSILRSAKYLITLDADTQLPRGTAAELSGTLAHPLNSARVNTRTGLVDQGYGVLQPRVAISLPSAGRSLFSALFAGDPGIDPYTRAVSDVYQDLFGEGSFVGKGILDIDIFHQVMHQRLPENSILSHDLLEGCHVRSGLVSDVLIFEDHPWNYGAEINRRHRWTRGDWQIAGWLLPWIRGADHAWVRNKLSCLSRWKIFDNLRRSLTPPAMVAMFFLAWLVLPDAGVWTLALVAAIVVPPLLMALWELTRINRDLPSRMHLSLWGADIARRMLHALLELAFLAFQAVQNMDAIIRAIVRMLITHRHLLQWRASRSVERGAANTLVCFFKIMWTGPLLALAGLLAMILFRGPPVPLAVAILLLWALSPLAAWMLSQPRVESGIAFDPTAQQFLRMIARRTWRYFEQYVTPADHHLPPDNFQEFPVPELARRTSPTNIGLALLANLAALDFGWITTGAFLRRSQNTLDTMAKLKRFRGHFFNWYSTDTLEPLEPLYISSVDSGNLAGHLLILRSGLAEIPNLPIIPQRFNQGMSETLLALAHEAETLSQRNQAASGLQQGQKEKIDQVAAQLFKLYAQRPESLRGILAQLRRGSEILLELDGRAEGTRAGPLGWWISALEAEHQDFIDEILLLAPWIQLPKLAEINDRLNSTVAGTYTDLCRTMDMLEQNISLTASANLCHRAAGLAQKLLNQHGAGDVEIIENLLLRLTEAGQRMDQRLAAGGNLEKLCRTFDDMDFRFLFVPGRKLMSIGFRVHENRLDAGFYDLLASEARLSSYVAIIQGQIPQEHWFALGRQLTSVGGHVALLSWSGSMFEYLMPRLVMPNYPNTLLDQTMRAAVDRNIEYGRERGIPWGVSESGYNMTDALRHYQYKAFGVPGLGFKRRLSDDVVIAPYASVLALMVRPQAAYQNLLRLAQEGRMGDCGYFEAVDYTPQRSSKPGMPATVRSFMSHHEGMSLLALTCVLLQEPMQRRFLADPLLRSGDLLLQEKVPRAEPIYPHAVEVAESRRPVSEEALTWRSYSTPQTPEPEVQLLSNGRYHLMITAAGGSRSMWNSLALTRWHADFTRDNWGLFCYLRDVESDGWWSATVQPTGRRGQLYEATFSEGKAEFRRRDGTIDTFMQVAVSPEDDIELRRIALTNRGNTARRIELTTYAEVVLAAPAADAAHPAFGNLFVQTYAAPDYHTLLATRRARSHDEHPAWMLHLVTVQGAAGASFSYQTDRAAFLGRGRSANYPSALEQRGPLPNTHGAVLDPALAIRREVIIEPDATVTIDVVLGAAATREQAEVLYQRYHDRRLTDRVLELAWSHNQVLLRQLNATDADAQLFGRLASSLLYPGPRFRAPALTLERNQRGQSGLWGFGISGDLPIVLLRLTDREHIALVRQILQAHAYWRYKGLAVDLVIWNQDMSGYRQELHDQIMAIVASGPDAKLVDQPGGIFIRRTDQMSEEDRTLMLAAAAIVLSDSAGTLAEQLESQGLDAEAATPKLVPISQPMKEPAQKLNPRTDLSFFNGIGGLTGDSREYVMTLAPGRVPPAPWCNVISGRQLGTVVTESGGMYTWVGNAHEYRLTPWYDDPVTDTSGEAFYIRDDQSGAFWSPTMLPAGGSNACVARHGFGYSIFERRKQGINSEFTVYADIEEPVKYYVLKLKNNSDRVRRLSVTGYWELTLGEARSKSSPHIITEIDEHTGAILARNAWSNDFGSWVAFAHISDNRRTITANRTEFLGRNGRPEAPAAMARQRLSGNLGPGLDPCAAIMASVELQPGAQKEVVWILGAAPDRTQAREIIERARTTSGARRALENVWRHWNRTLGCIYLETPDPSVNALANGWLLYQVISSRIWGRSGFYQSGGAYGFRDQLQDAMAAALTDPLLLRRHLLRAAGRQFEEGDVQHWWHPPTGRGVRTKFSDDLLWLPLAVCRYVSLTHDTGVLDEKIGFLRGRPVGEHEESWYDLPQSSDQTGTLYEHCVRALQCAMKFGAHDLPLIGCGDWNDGFNRIGAAGRGESVWLAFFLRAVMAGMLPLAQQRGDQTTVDLCQKQMAALESAVAQHCWDGQWYLRAFFDNGAPVGSARNRQCRIDSLPQSWSVLSNTGDPDRQKQAMQAVDQHLVRRDVNLIQLFDPPFDNPEHDPGYIAGYLPGVRENGGQYTHAAIWAVMAFAMAGDTAKAWELFRLINPLNHSNSPEKVAIYRVEPYVMAADVYAMEPYQGRGGWTWYTGSAAWMYRLIIESLIGWRQEGQQLWFEPRLPANWREFRVHYRYRETFYHITFTSGGNTVTEISVDNAVQSNHRITLEDNRRDHAVIVKMR